jgi:16S rRNA (guanine966-N2)-methyltransferase
MRIVGGRFKGRKIHTPKSDAARPTTDRNRESLFNILAHNPDVSLSGARVLDLFAGTGALGFEALSRGATFGLFVEMGAEQRGVIRTTMHELGLQGVAKIFRRDATSLGPIGTMQPFDLVFADPPYGKGLGELALLSVAENNWLKPGATVVLEEAADADFDLPESFDLSDERRMGGSMMRILTYQSD